MKYRKKPIIIEAYKTDVELDIETLEGVMHASIGDYIITGINGEKYPCKPDIFEKTYEKVDDGSKPLQNEYVNRPTPLEVLERLRPKTTYEPYYTRSEKRYYCDIIETALKEHELMKEIRITARFDLAQVNKEHKALAIIKDCLVSEFKLFEKDGEYFILFYFDEIHQLIFKLKGKEEYDLLKEVLL